VVFDVLRFLRLRQAQPPGEDSYSFDRLSLRERVAMAEGFEKMVDYRVHRFFSKAPI
tara:strand:+ start:438 stop:608 length:171 start_codon:yes stop_codon:yes gene_type:complete